MHSSGIEQQPSIAATPAPVPRQLVVRLLLQYGGMVLCAGIAVLMSLLQNLRHDASRVTMAYDSGHYIGTVQALVAAYLVEFQHISPADLLTKFGVDLSTLTPSLLLDGPLMPLTGALVFSAMGRPPVGPDWQVLVLIETAFQFVATLCIYVCATRLTGRKLWGTVAGLAWATYPAAVIGCNNFLSEVPVVALSTAYILGLAHVVAMTTSDRWNFRSTVVTLLTGLCAAVVVITKPALLFALFGSVIAFLFFTRIRGAKVVPFLAMGACIAMVPWGCWTNHATGHVYLSARRAPTMNVVKGSDPTTDGWNTLPASNYSATFPENMGPARALSRIVAEKPLESVNLASRKIERLWTFPWNDFRYGFLGLSINIQIWWHRILLLAGLFGFAAFFARRERTPVSNVVGWTCLVFVCGHLAYIPFETLSRYGFTAMPFFIIMAAYGLYSVSVERQWFNFSKLMIGGIAISALNSIPLLPFLLVGSQSIRIAYGEELALRIAAMLVLAWFAVGCLSLLAENKRPTKLAIAFVAFVLAIAVGTLYGHVTYAGELREWRSTLKPGWSAVRKVHVNSRGAKWALALFDADQSIGAADVLINGKVLPGKMASYFVYDPAHYYLQDYIQGIANLDKKDAINMRQWRAMVVPLDYLSANGDNEIAVRAKNAGRVTVYGAYPGPLASNQALPSFTLISPSKILRNLDGLETRVTDQTYTIPMANDSALHRPGSADTQDLSNEPGKQPGQYRIYLAIGHGPPDAPIAKDAGIIQQIDAKTFGQPAGADALIVSSELKTNIGLKPTLEAAKHLRVHMSGQLRSASPSGALAVTITAEGRQAGEGPLLVPGTPCMIPAGPGWTPFQINADTPVQALPHGLSRLRLALIGTGANGVLVKDCTFSVASLNLPTFAGHAVQLY